MTPPLRRTKAREIILDIVKAAREPQDAAMIVHAVQAKDKKINRATVFRTLHTLTVSGIVEKVDFGERKARYEIAGNHHHHLVCTKCHAIMGVDLCPADDLRERIHEQTGFHVISHRLEYFGLCKKCTVNRE